MDSNGHDRSFGAPYYRSPDYQTRYPAYLRNVAPPLVSINILDVLYPRRFFVRKMATSVVNDFKVETKWTNKRTVFDMTRKAKLRKKKRSLLQIEEKLPDDISIKYKFKQLVVKPVVDNGVRSPKIYIDDDTKTLVAANDSMDKSLPSPPYPVIDEFAYPVFSAHVQMDKCYPRQYPPPPPSPSTLIFKNYTHKNSQPVLLQPKPPPPPFFQPPPLPTLPLLSSLPSSSPFSQHISKKFTENYIDPYLHPVEKCKQIAKWFEQECGRRRQLIPIIEKKALAKAFVDQAEEIVKVAKSGHTTTSI